MKLSFSTKFCFLSFLVGSTVLYSIWQKNTIRAEKAELVLTILPDSQVKKLYSEDKIDIHQLIENNARGLFVHFWATWCGPCESELPDFLSFAEKYENKNVIFLLVAVQDNEVKIRKFLKRYNRLPDNVFLGHDVAGELLNLYGTAKLPETYLFDKSKRHLSKYVGPQNWLQQSYADRVNSLLFLDESINKASKSYKVETH